MAQDAKQETMRYRVRYKKRCWAQKNDPGKEEICGLLTDDIEEAKKMATGEVLAAEHDVWIVENAVLEELSPDGNWQLIAKWPDW